MRLRASARYRAVAISFVAAALALSLAGARDALAQGVRVHVRGTSRIEAHAARAGGKLLLSGTLVDDAARPVGGEKVTVTIARRSDASRPLPVSGAMAAACGDVDGGDRARALAPTIERADTLAIKTDDVGRFCVKLALPVDRYVAHLAFNAAGSIDATQTDLPIDLALKPLSLAFDPPPRAVSLDGAALVLEVVASVDDEGSSTPGANLPLSLTNEAATPLASGTTNNSGRVRFNVPAASLGPPGRGELRVTFNGNADTGGSQYVAQIERHTRVELATPEAKDGKLPSGAPEDGVAIQVIARARATGDSSAPGGTIEAHVGDTLVGAAPLDAGKARLVVTFATPSTAEVTLRLKYVPDAPWFEAGSDAIVAMPVRGPSPWRHAPVVVAGLAVLAWLALGRTRTRPQRDKAPPSSRRTPFRGEAKVEVLRVDPGQRGWTGHVFDAHEGTPVAHARVAIERAGFDGLAILVSSETREDGSFALAHVDTHDGDRLACEGALHAAFFQNVPPSGELAIAVVSRKRALLDRLVGWARRRGRPFDAAPEPTPGHVRRAAGAEFPIARWADAVERAAFGGAPLDAAAEADVERLAPEAQRPIPSADAHDTIVDEPRDAKAKDDDSSPGGVSPSGL